MTGRFVLAGTADNRATCTSTRNGFCCDGVTFSKRSSDVPEQIFRIIVMLTGSASTFADRLSSVANPFPRES